MNWGRLGGGGSDVSAQHVKTLLLESATHSAQVKVQTRHLLHLPTPPSAETRHPRDPVV